MGVRKSIGGKVTTIKTETELISKEKFPHIDFEKKKPRVYGLYIENMGADEIEFSINNGGKLPLPVGYYWELTNEDYDEVFSCKVYGNGAEIMWSAME